MHTSLGELETALGAWKHVLLLIESGTPVDGIKIIAEYNIKGLNALIKVEHEA